MWKIIRHVFSFKQKTTQVISPARLLLLSAMVLPAVFANAQTIKGTVSGKEGQLPGASVQSPATKQGTSTDLNGSFTLNTHTTGKVKVLISYIGHTPKEIELDIKTGINDAGVIILTPAEGQLGEVLVKGTMAPSQIKALSIKKTLWLLWM
ncbi:carboxypeptidase-like regulatory domain-containing protein [Chitinophaga pinensis]|uniref:carboxypeptidase-like regulatory domain-containing protein n=1 Tax=Chitinophaga pinensis TaxID=79329 RepID=UPI001C99A058|nr:carboxypeptidase-like regulatory domain-containing protein [Chitinophaga pinensis]